MRINNERVVKQFVAEGGAIPVGRIVVWGTADTGVKLPSGADVGGIVGIVTNSPNSGVGDLVEVCMFGATDLNVKAAGTNIAKGDPISIHGTTGSGKKAAPGAGTNTFLVGFAAEAATADDVLVSVEIIKSVYQG